LKCGFQKKVCASKSPTSFSRTPLPARRRKTETTTMNIENGLKMINEKEKRFSFLPTRKKKKAESRPTFGTLPFARHTSQRFAKVKEPNLPSLNLYILEIDYFQNTKRYEKYNMV
jgi:hypothetical protein